MDNENNTGKKNTGDIGTTKSELTRQTFQPIRRLMLERLQSLIREPGLVEAEPAKIPFAESESPLAKYLVEPKAK